MSQDVLATMNRDTRSNAMAKEVNKPIEPGISPAFSSRVTTPDPSNIYLAPQILKIFEQMDKAAMGKINRVRKKNSLTNVSSNARINQLPEMNSGQTTMHQKI